MPKHILTKEDSIKGGKVSKRRPLDKMWKDKLEAYIESKDTTLLDGLFKVMLSKAGEGNIQAIKEILDRSYGRAIQPIQHTGDSEQPVIIRTEQQKKFIEGDE